MLDFLIPFSLSMFVFTGYNDSLDVVILSLIPQVGKGGSHSKVGATGWVIDPAPGS